MSDEAKTRHISFEARVANLEDNARRTTTTTPQGVPPWSQSVVVFGSWPEDTERSRIIDDGYPYQDIYMPAPRHTIGKVGFRTPAETWRLRK